MYKMHIYIYIQTYIGIICVYVCRYNRYNIYKISYIVILQRVFCRLLERL